eukprot:scaffold9801_cov51-Attheya_sp.AAC.3
MMWWNRGELNTHNGGGKFGQHTNECMSTTRFRSELFAKPLKQERQSPINNAHSRRQGGVRKKSSTQNSRSRSTVISNRPNQRKGVSSTYSGGSGEKTVVILYYKPSNVITSHSSADETPKTSIDGKKSRMTVYEDVMSMQGFVAEDSFVNKAGDEKMEEAPDDDNDSSMEDYYATTLSFQDVTKIQSKLHAVGRLDVDTTGLLLLTNDGQLVHQVTNPTASNTDTSGAVVHHSVSKTYEALIMGYHTIESSEAMQQIVTKGVDIGPKYGGWTQPAIALDVLDHPTPTTTLVSITICEGKNRQIRRMFHGVKSGVMKLKRVSIGDSLTLGSLQEGQWRLLTKDEIKKHLDWKIRDVGLQ